MNNTNSNSTSFQREGGGSSADVKRILYHAWRYWYVVVGCVMVSIFVAFLVNRYSTRVYSIKGSIILKESEEVSGAELLYNNPLVKFYRNYQNELYIITSNPLIERTVAELGLEKTLYKIGKLKKSEIYRKPFEVEIVRNVGDVPFDFYLHFESSEGDKFSISYEKDEKSVDQIVGFGEIVDLDGIHVRVSKVGASKVESDFTGEYQFVYRRNFDVAQDYISRLKTEWAEEGSGVIILSITGSNTEKEEDFLRALISNYQAIDLERKNVAASNAIHFINEQLRVITDSLNEAERQLALFKNQNIVTDLNSEAIRLYQKMEGLEVQTTDLLIRDRYYNHLKEYITSKVADMDQAILPSSVGINDPILSELVSKMIEIQTELKLYDSKLRHPLVSTKLRQMDELRNDILESVKNQRSIDRIKLDFLKQGITEIEKQLRALPQAERQLVNIKRNYALSESIYTFLLQKRAEAGITKASNTTDVVVVNPPKAIDVISPNLLRNYALSIMLGVILPFGFFAGREIFNTKVQSREDVEKLTAIPFIGGIGHKRDRHYLEVLQRPKSAISESFRALRSNLYFFLNGKEKGVFLITSSISGEGKTFTSINLASVFALSGKQVLIVGADMRRPKIFSDFELSNDTGLSSYLAGISPFSDVIQKTQFENLHLVSGGPVPPNPSELILTSAMDEFLETAKKKYDFIFIDSPPLALVTDAFALASKVDHTLFIVRQNYTQKSFLAAIDDFYVNRRITSVSIVLNDIYKSGPGYGYGYNYGYDYGYGYGYGRKKLNGGYYEE